MTLPCRALCLCLSLSGGPHWLNTIRRGTYTCAHVPTRTYAGLGGAALIKLEDKEVLLRERQEKAAVRPLIHQSTKGAYTYTYVHNLVAP
jgi:hypothetical protein